MGIISSMDTRDVSLENPNVALGQGFTLLDVLGGGKTTAAGRRVNEEAALHVSAFFAGVNIIASAMGSLSCKLYRRRDDGGKEEERGHPLWQVLQLQPNPEMAATPYREAKQGHVLLRGNAYSEIVFSGRGQVLELWPIPPRSVDIVRRGGEMVYRVRIGEDEKFLPKEWVLHIAGLGGDGVSGWSVVRFARESLALGLASEEYGARFFSNNARPSGILSHPASLSDDAAKRLRNSWENASGGLSNAHRVAVLEEGVQWQQMGLSAEDSQFLETRQFQVREIARWLNIPPHKIGDLSDATFSNIEEQSLEFVQDTLMPWIRRWEQACNVKLLSASERAAGLFVEFPVQGLLRADVEKRGAFYQTRFNTGSITPNQIRALENENPIDGGDEAFVQINMMPLSQAMNMSPEERTAAMLAANGVIPPEFRAMERRDHRERLRVRAEYLDVLRDAAGRVVRGEVRNLRKAKKRLLKDGDVAAFREWLLEYYFREHPAFMIGQFAAPVGAYASAMARAAANEITLESVPRIEQFTELFLESFSHRYSASSRTELENLADQSDTPSEDLETRFGEWMGEDTDNQPRSERVASRVSTEFGNAVTSQVFAVGGIATLISRTVGDTCPYCTALDGRTVAIGEPMFQPGDEFQPEGTDTPLRFKSIVKYPPYHRGCNCIVVPGEGT